MVPPEAGGGIGQVQHQGEEAGLIMPATVAIISGHRSVVEIKSHRGNTAAGGQSAEQAGIGAEIPDGSGAYHIQSLGTRSDLWDRASDE